MSQEYAKAYPRKRFFVEMFTRDISAEDCVLDLVDNSIDALIRQRKLDLDKTVIDNKLRTTHPRGAIRLTISPKKIVVEDDCGGISLTKAKNEVFNFGHSKQGINALTEKGIGAYGVGLKRAIFKLGRHFQVESVQKSTSFVVEQDLEDWVSKDERIEDWQFPLQSKSITGLNTSTGGTRVTITRLKPEILDLIAGDQFADSIATQIARTYGPFLEAHADVDVNGERVTPNPIPLGINETLGLQKEEYEEDGVSVRIVASVAAPGPRGVWEMEKAGWYVVCNGRVVVFADRTTLTGWGAGILPQFHSSKARGFVGVATFVSDDPLKLPWTTTKRGLNRESPVFIRAQSRMQRVGSIVYRALESMVPAGVDDDSASSVRKGTSQASLQQVMGGGASRFTFRVRRTKAEVTEASIQYRVPPGKLTLVKKHIGRSSMSNGEVGQYTFDYFVKQDGLE